MGSEDELHVNCTKHGNIPGLTSQLVFHIMIENVLYVINKMMRTILLLNVHYYTK